MGPGGPEGPHAGKICNNPGQCWGPIGCAYTRVFTCFWALFRIFENFCNTKIKNFGLGGPYLEKIDIPMASLGHIGPRTLFQVPGKAKTIKKIAQATPKNRRKTAIFRVFFRGIFTQIVYHSTPPGCLKILSLFEFSNPHRGIGGTTFTKPGEFGTAHTQLKKAKITCFSRCRRVNVVP